MVTTLLIIVFIIGYVAIAFEHAIKLNKAASALITGVLCWTIYILQSNSVDTVGDELLHHLAQRAVHFEIGDVKRHSWVGAPPQNRLALTEPWKNGIAVGAPQRVNVKCSASSQQPRGRRLRSPSLFHRRKGLTGCKAWQIGRFGAHG